MLTVAASTGVLLGAPSRLVGQAAPPLSREAGPALVFDSVGRLVARVGRQGRGPGEFDGISGIVPVAKDSVIVIDGSNGRATVIGPDLTPGRSVAVPWQIGAALVLRWPDSIVVSGLVGSADARGKPLHLVSFAGRDAVRFRSFGPEGWLPGPGSARLATLFHLLATDPASGWYSTNKYEYAISAWGDGSRSVAEIGLSPAWFDRPSMPWMGNPSTPPPPSLVAIRAIGADRLLVLGRTAASGWRAAWSAVPAGAREVPSRQIDYVHLFDTVVELVDVGRRQIVASTGLAGVPLGFAGGDRLALYAEDEDGSPLVRIVRIPAGLRCLAWGSVSC